MCLDLCSLSTLVIDRVHTIMCFVFVCFIFFICLNIKVTQFSLYNMLWKMSKAINLVLVFICLVKVQQQFQIFTEYTHTVCNE